MWNNNMPWVETDFEARAGRDGKFSRDEKLSAPVSGKLKNYRVQTQTGCKDRTHTTVLVVVRTDDLGDTVRIGPLPITDCKEVVGAIEPAFRIRGGKAYRITLESDGFDAEELIKGKAGVEFSFFLDMARENR